MKHQHVFICKVDTRNFTFEGFGHDADSALTACLEAINRDAAEIIKSALLDNAINTHES